MAPEQVHSGVEPISPATDIYALGIVLYELVTDEMPFKGNSTTVMALKRIKEKPVSPREVVPDLDARWEATIMRCLERSPARRFQTAVEVQAALIGDLPPPRAAARARPHRKARLVRSQAQSLTRVCGQRAARLPTRSPKCRGARQTGDPDRRSGPR